MRSISPMTTTDTRRIISKLTLGQLEWQKRSQQHSGDFWPCLPCLAHIRAGLPQTGLRIFHDLSHGLQNAFVVHSAQTHSLAPAHLLQHVASLVLVAKLRHAPSHDFAVPQPKRSLPGSVASTPWPRRVGLRPLEVGAGEIFAMDALRGLADMLGCHLDRCVPDGPVGPVQHGATLVTLAGGLGLDVEPVGELVEDFASVVVDWGEFETACC